MFVVMGATGHVGSAVVDALLARGQRVTVVTHDAAHGDNWDRKGVDVAVADIMDVATLRSAFKRGRRAFLINPPASIKDDTDAIETRTVANMLAALEGSGLEKVVAQSTAGAMPGKGIGDSSVLWEFEQGLARQSIPAVVNRAAFYMSNWDTQLEQIKKSGVLQTMYPADFALPMAAPHDLGVVAAERLVSSLEDVETRYVEGPARYSSEDVARAFAQAIGRPVKVASTPAGQLRQTYRKLGFSDAAAEAYSRMTEETLRSDFDYGDDVIRCPTSLQSYINALVH